MAILSSLEMPACTQVIRTAFFPGPISPANIGKGEV